MGSVTNEVSGQEKPHSKDNMATCFVCGAEFKLTKSRQERNKSGIFTCSRECWEKRIKKEPNVECSYCGKEFYLKPYRIKKAKQHYCSQECCWQHRKELYSGDGNHQFGLKGELNGSHLSDIHLSVLGYLEVYCHTHPFRNNVDKVLLHRLIIEEYLRENDPSSHFLVSVEGYEGQFLSPEAVVHHKNEIRTDNRLENLEVMSLGDHTYLHTTNNKESFIRCEKTGRFVGKTDTGQYKKESDVVKTLFKKHSQDAGLDMVSAVDITVPSKGYSMIPTGTNIAVPENHVGLLWSRSGLAIKHGIEVGAGCIDASYRGEVIVKLYNHSDQDFDVTIGDKIAQLLTIPVNLAFYEEVDDLDDTDRGQNGFGSTGMKA